MMNLRTFKTVKSGGGLIGDLLGQLLDFASEEDVFVGDRF